MNIHANFPGGNIELIGIYGDHIWLRPHLRDTKGDWFFWAFCVEGAAGQTITFDFSADKIGYFGPAISHDMHTWHFAGSETLVLGNAERQAFTYTFAPDENLVYFAHDIVYRPERLDALANELGKPLHTHAVSRRGYNVPALTLPGGDTWIVLTSRHHSCESSGSYFLEGVTRELAANLPGEFSVLVLPFMDYDGVLYGDQGKNRVPHDQNRDYTDNPIYPEVANLQAFANNYKVKYAFDFHSPWHLGGANDDVFFVRQYKNPDGQDTMSALFRKESANLRLRYDGNSDIMPDVDWNSSTIPMFDNYFAKFDSVELTFTLEIPYFGKPDNMVDQTSPIELGRAFGRALIAYINQNPKASDL